MNMSEEKYVLDLIERLKPHLPMTAYPGKSLIARYRSDYEGQPKIKFKKDQKLEVTDAHYLGDEGGLSFAYGSPVKGDGHVMITSVTHLKLDPKHPFYKELRAYQLARTTRLAQQHGRRTLPETVLYSHQT